MSWSVFHKLNVGYGKLRLLSVAMDNNGPVSYTHLDVYKRQHLGFIVMDKYNSNSTR